MKSDDETEAGMTKSEAIERGINFAWDNVLSGDEKNLGVGLHALQDVSAHQGASSKEHLGSIKAVHYLGKDVSGFTAGDARRLTSGAMTLFGIVTGNEKIINNAKDKEGNINIELQGGVTRESLNNIWQAVLNSNYNGSVYIRFE